MFWKKIFSWNGDKSNGVICPYCGFLFKEMPSRKRKCPDCKETIYRKRTPSEKQFKLVTKEKANEIELLWSEHYINKEIQEIGEKKYNSAKQELKKNLGQDPNHRMIIIQVYKSEAEIFLEKGLYADYSGLLNKIGWELYEMKEYNQSFMKYLEAAYIDGNGHFSKGKFQEFGRNIPPGIINPLKNTIIELEVSEGEVHKIFVNLNTALHHQINSPLHPQDVWHDQLKEKLFDKD